MRTRALVSLALLSLPSIVSSQIMPPRTGVGRTPTPVTPAPLPPAAPEIARELAYKRSRWAVEAYSLYSAIQVPAATGSVTTSVIGGGTHGDYRLTNSLSGTADVTYATLGTSNTSYQTAELGARYMLPIADLKTRPFIDARATYMALNDVFNSNFVQGGGGVMPSSRYSRGLGGFAGVGVMRQITGSFSLTTEVAALRNQMTTYQSSGYRPVDAGQRFWSTMYRFTIGARYNSQRSLYLSQNPRQ